MPHNIINAKVLRESLLRLGSWVADHAIDGPAHFRPPRSLASHSPRLRGTTLAEVRAAHQGSTELRSRLHSLSIARYLRSRARRVQENLHRRSDDCGPGEQRLKIGVAAVSHKVISKLLKDTASCARNNENLKAIQRSTAAIAVTMNSLSNERE